MRSRVSLRMYAYLSLRTVTTRPELLYPLLTHSR